MHWNRQKIKSKRKQIAAGIRILVQIFFFIAAPALFSQAFGGVKSSAALMGEGNPLELLAFVKSFLVLAALTVCFGRIFCGWACAFGALGDWVYLLAQTIAKKIGIRPKQIPESWTVHLQKLKYCVLFLILLLCFWGKQDEVTEYSPWTVFSFLTAGNFSLQGYAVGTVLLVFILIGMAVQERFFCQFLCPMGAIFSLLPELPFLTLKRRKSHCINGCSACKAQCPVKLKLQETPEREGECIRCGRCMQVCPRGNIHVFGADGNEEQKEQTT